MNRRGIIWGAKAEPPAFSLIPGGFAVNVCRVEMEPNDTDRRNNSALFGGTVSDSCDAPAFLIRHPNTSLKETDPRGFLVLIFVVLPFVVLIYFGAAFLISDTISERADWLKAMRLELGADWLKVMRSKLTFTESLVGAVTYVGLSGWLWLRWRNPMAPSTRVFGSAIIATVTIFIIGGVVCIAHYDQIF